MQVNGSSARHSGALVIGASYRALGIVRSLGRRGIRVGVLTDEHFVAAVSRYSQFHLPWPAVDEPAQVQYLLDICERRQLEGWAVFPTDEETAALVARNHEILSECFRLTIPGWDVIRWSYDKRLTHRLGSEIGLDQPRTFAPKNREDVATLECTFPVVLKPAFKHKMNRFTHAKAWRVDNREALLSSYDEACTLVDADIIMIQELIPGGGEDQLSFAAFCVDGRPLAWMTARRTRQYPMDFGLASSYVESVDLPEIEAPARRLLQAMNFTGLVEVEFKRDSRDGRYKLLDVNSRVWGWHSLGGRAGADFAYLLWQWIHGEAVPEVRARPGVGWIRMATDLAAVLGELLHRRMSLRQYLRSLRGPVEFAIFAFDDPLPALFDAPFMAWMAWKRRARVERHNELDPVAQHRDSPGEPRRRKRSGDDAIRRSVWFQGKNNQTSSDVRVR